MTPSTCDPPVFGSAPIGITCHPRLAAYAVVVRDDGRVATVRASRRRRACYWLPGGGALPGEEPEATVTREVREELGRGVRLIRRIGKAVQFFYASEEDRWYEMIAVFFRAELVSDSLDAGEAEIHWLDGDRQGDLFFHASHSWAASQP